VPDASSKDARVADLVYRGEDGRAITANEGAFSYYHRLQRVRNYVQATPAHTVSLDEAAKIACLERKYFSAFFRAKVGIGFTRWQKRLRISRALEILRSRDDSVLQVARSCGFRSVRTFERAFKHQIGLTALEFKLRVRP